MTHPGGAGCPSSEGVETSSSHGCEKQRLQSCRTADLDSEGAHRPVQGNLDMEMVSSIYTHERHQESTHMHRIGNGSTGLCGSSATGTELVAMLTSPKLAQNLDQCRPTMSNH